MVRSCLVAVTAVLVLAPAAHAADVRVVNERGIPQLALWSDDGTTPSFTTDPDGYIRDVDPGKTLRVTRSTLDPAQYPCFKNTGGAPEGPNGVSFTVPESGGTIILPNATGPSYQPDSNDAERWIIGKINELRAQRGAPPVRVSAVLNRVADSVARKQFTDSLSFPPPFCPVVALDWGFPAFAYSSVDAGGTDPRKAWAHWSDGSVREKAVVHPDWDVIGVGDGGGAWTAYLGKCPAGREARCEISTDQGDPTIQLPPAQAEPTPTPGGGTTDPPGAEGPAMGSLTFAPKQRGKAVAGTVEVARAGSAVTVRLKQGAKPAGLLVLKDVAAGALPVRVALNRNGKRLLKQAKSLALTVVVTVDPPTGQTGRATAKVRLRR